MGSAAERAGTASALRDEAHALLTRTRIFELLSRSFTDPMVTGSASYDLMVRRDIDIHMAVDAGRYRDWMSFGATLVKFFDAIGMPLLRAQYVNAWAGSHPLGGGLQWELGFNDEAGAAWQVDLWGWDPFDYAVRQARDFSLKTDLEAVDRDLVLRLKTEALARPRYYGVIVNAFDIYRFVIAGGGETLDALERWQRAQ